MRVNFVRDGAAWCARMQDFKNLQESPAGFGDTQFEAVCNLASQLRASEMQLEAVSALNPPAIRVWRFDQAPAIFQQLSPHGGDEDWLAFVPFDVQRRGNIGWLEGGTPFGCCDVSEHEVLGGVVYIGAHA